MLEKVGIRLKEARDSNNLTQKQVERATGINSVMLSYYENGKREISVSELGKLANLYGYDIRYFLNYDIDLKEPDIAIAFRAEEVDDDDLEMIDWCKQFLNNVFEMKRLIGGR